MTERVRMTSADFFQSLPKTLRQWRKSSCSSFIHRPVLSRFAMCARLVCRRSNTASSAAEGLSAADFKAAEMSPPCAMRGS